MKLEYNVFGCFRDPLADIELAQAAVDAGFEGIWVGDHFLPWIDSRPYTHHTWAWLGSLMASVSDVPVGTSVTCPMLRYQPTLLAQAIATLDNMYPGRIHFGVGTGEALNEVHFLDGDWPDWDVRADMLVESIELMRTLWRSEEYIAYDGEHFQHSGIKLYTRPREKIPIHWAGWGPRSCQYAGEHADHLLTAVAPETIRDRIRPNLHKGLDRADRSPEGVEITTELSVNIGDPDALVSEICSRGEYIPLEELDNADPRDIQAAADEQLAAMTDAEIADALNITDDLEDIVEILEDYEAAGTDRVLVGSVCGDPHETIRAFEETILPRFD